MVLTRTKNFILLLMFTTFTLLIILLCIVFAIPVIFFGSFVWNDTVYNHIISSYTNMLPEPKRIIKN